MFINSSQGELSKTLAFLMFSFIILYSDVVFNAVYWTSMSK